MSGVDVEAGGCSLQLVGVARRRARERGDSLAAVSHLIYETRCRHLGRRCSRRSIATGKAHEELRQRCIRAPKYGAGDPRADAWDASSSASCYADAFARCRSPKGGRLVVGLVEHGDLRPPRPLAGRRPTAGVAASCSPTRRRRRSTRRRSGRPPRTSRTLAASTPARTPNGVTFNQRFSASAVASDARPQQVGGPGSDVRRRRRAERAVHRRRRGDAARRPDAPRALPRSLRPGRRLQRDVRRAEHARSRTPSSRGRSSRSDGSTPT